MRRFAYTLAGFAALVLFTTVSALNTGQDPQTRTEVETIPYEVKYVFNREMGAGRLKKVQHGVDGKLIKTIVDRDGEAVVISVEKVESVPAVFHMGKPSSRAVSRGTYTRAKIVTMESTAYTPRAGRKNPTFRTYSGTKAEYGVIAVDPHVIPLGTLMYVEGYGFGIAEDIGGAIKGNKIDVCIEDRKQALAWGRKKVKVHIFDKRIELPPDHEKSSNGSG